MRKILALGIRISLLEQLLKGRIKNLMTSFKSSGQDENGCMFKILISFQKGGEPIVTVIEEVPSHFGEKI